MKYRDSIGSWFAGKWHLHLAFQSFHQGTEFSQTASKTVKTSSCLDSFCQVSCPSNPPWNLSSSAHPSQNCTQLQLGGRENGHQLILHLIMDGHHSVEDHWLIERRICADILIQCVLHSVPAVLEGANLFAKSDCSPLLQSAQSISVRHTKKRPTTAATNEDGTIVDNAAFPRDFQDTGKQCGKQLINMAKRQTPMIGQPLIDVHFSQQR